MNERISDLKKQLLDLGYHQYQIDNILRDAVGTTNIESLGKEEAAQIADELMEYIAFAAKCHKKRV